MDDETRSELYAGLIRLGFAVLTLGVTLAVSSVTFRDRIRAWWYAGVELVADAPEPEPTDADIAAVHNRARQILRGEDV